MGLFGPTKKPTWTQGTVVRKKLARDGEQSYLVVSDDGDTLVVRDATGTDTTEDRFEFKVDDKYYRNYDYSYDSGML